MRKTPALAAQHATSWNPDQENKWGGLSIGNIHRRRHSHRRLSLVEVFLLKFENMCSLILL